MKQENKYRIIIGGGGTGGHIFPAISIANALSEKLDDVEFLFVGARGKIEMEKVPEAGYRIVGLPVAGFSRSFSVKNITFFARLLRSMQQSAKLIRQFRPHLAIGVGGYASGPIVRAAARRRIPVLLQEQNSYAGVTNRLLGKSAKRICVAYEGMERYFPREKIVFTGNPIRQDLLLPDKERANSYRHFGLRSDRKVILLVGGSGGARTLNESMMDHLDRVENSGIQWIWQCGNYYHEKALASIESGEFKNVKLVPFIREMNRAFQVADVIISRAGAGTISELCMVGKPVILVPSPNVAEDHQTRNAMALTNHDAGMMIADKDARDLLVDRAIDLVKDEQTQHKLAENIKKLAIPDASHRIAGEVIKILEQQ